MHIGNAGNMNYQEIFRNKKVFLTGHTGFKGSWLLAWLNNLGANIKGYALAPVNEYDLYCTISGDDLCHSIIADIRDYEKLKKEILTFQPDFIFHLAAQPLVLESYNNPLYTHETNILGTANLLDSLRFLEKKCVAVLITTDKVYHNYESGQAYNEDDRLGGYDPYSASKGAAEILIASYRNSFFNPVNYIDHQKSVSVARAGNVIGGGDWSENRIIPDIVRALSNNEEVVLRNPLSVRPWQHVLEPLSGYLSLASHQYKSPVEYADAFNFGPNLIDNLAVEDVTKIAIASWGKGNYCLSESKQNRHEAGLLQLDISKANKLLNWFPKYNAQKAIHKTIHWYQQFLEMVPAHDLIMNDLSDFR
jgi:CDP-glucose 4,6-dehydratase